VVIIELVLYEQAVLDQYSVLM